MIVLLTILGLGLLTMAVGGVLTLVAAFQRSVLWGLASLLLPFASLVFLIRHWAEAKRGFFVGLVGFAIVAVPLLGPSDLRTQFVTELQARAAQTRHPAAPAPDLTAQIATLRGRIEQLEGQFTQTGAPLAQRYQALAVSRSALKPGDTAAVTRFNAEAAAYQQQTDALRQTQQEIGTARTALDALLAARAKQAAAPGGAAGSRKVVMYTTAQCPACQQAKQYLAQRGVPYEERNVRESKTAAEEFQRLGGRGVPLIMVGEKRLEGFSAPALDRLL